MKLNLLPLLLLSGCVAVPSTKIDLSKGTFVSPKDDAFANLDVSYQDAAGHLTTVKAASAGGMNNPAVIAATAAGQNLLTATYFQGVNDTLASVTKGVLAGLGIGLPGLLTPTGGVPATIPVVVSNVVNTLPKGTNAPAVVVPK